MERLKKKIKADDRGKRDLKGKAKNIKVFPSPGPFPLLIMSKTRSTKDDSYSMTETSFKQLCKILDIPPDYVGKCPPTLRANNLDFWLSVLEKDTKWSIRVKEKIIRGIVSGKTMPFMNRDIATMIESLEGLKDIKKMIDWVYLDDSTMHFRILFPEIPILFEGEAKTKGVLSGLHISNSEVGKHPIRVDYIAFREQSDSTIIGLFNSQRFFRPRMAYDSLERLKEDLEKVILKIEDYRKALSGQIDKARQKGIKDFHGWSEKLRKKHKFAMNIAERANEIYTNDPELNLWGASCAFAKVGRERFDGEKRYEVESLAGNLLAAIK